MPERSPEQDADDAAAFYKRLRDAGVDDVAARQALAAYILGKMRQQEPKQEWE